MLGAYYDTTAPRQAFAASSQSARSRSTTTAPAYISNEQALASPNYAFSDSPLPPRTLDDVRSQVASEIAIRAVHKSELVDGVKTGVVFSLGNNEEADFLRRIADCVWDRLRLTSAFLFILADTCPTSTTNTTSPGNTLLILASSEDLVQRAALLASSKFVGRILSSCTEEPSLWSALIHDLGASTYDDAALWDVARKASRSPIDPLLPPPRSQSISQLLSAVRAELQRVSARQAWAELLENQVGAPTFLVDIRPEGQRARYGGVQGSLVVERNVLEWRLDPRSDSRLAIADRYDLRVIVFCQEGYASSLAAYSLQQLGLLNATDIIGGYEAWRLAGLPVDTQDKRRERSLASRAGSVV